jgi:regulation of enolase protein 1 (concanavalin A-like superfamily)
MSEFTLSSIPRRLQWRNRPLDWSAGDGTRLTITASELTDLFIDPSGSGATDNVPSALFAPPDTSFLLSARVMVDFASTYDAGVLQLREKDDLWAKLCFEYSPQQEPTVVSVVTRGTSDDCNSTVIDGREVFLRIAHTPEATAFHYSRDGHFWHMVRFFSLGRLSYPKVGFSSQSPTGKKCTAIFSDIIYRPGALKNRRNGE